MEKDVDKNEYLTFEEALAFIGLSKDAEKLTFLGKYGFLFDDEDVKKYNRERMSEEEW